MTKGCSYPVLALAWIGVGVSAVTCDAALPTYSVTRISELVPVPLQAGAITNYSQHTFSISGGSGGQSFVTGFADFNRLIGPPNPGFVVAHEEYYITDSSSGAVLRHITPPAGYETGIGGATRASTAGHLAFTVSDNRTDPNWLAGIEIARANPNGTVDVLTGLKGAEQRGVNALGQVVAIGSNEASTWRYTNGIGWQNLGALPGTSDAVPIGMNDSGTVVGRGTDSTGNPKPFYYTDSGGMQTFTDGAGNALFGEASAVNNNGLIAGTANGRAFVFNGSTMEFTFLTPATDQKVTDINSAGAILGVFRIGSSLDPISSLGWIATKDDGFNLLENLIGANPSDPEWRIGEAQDINDEGWILANAYNRRDQLNYRVLLRPVPEPGATLLLVMTGSLLLLRRRGKTF